MLRSEVSILVKNLTGHAASVGVFFFQKLYEDNLQVRMGTPFGLQVT